jgi:hypothetical protein
MRARQPHTPHPQESARNPVCSAKPGPSRPATSRHVFSPFVRASQLRFFADTIERERHDAVLFCGHRMPCCWRRLTASDPPRAVRTSFYCRRAAATKKPVRLCSFRQSQTTDQLYTPTAHMDCTLAWSILQHSLRLSCDELTQENETVVGGHGTREANDEAYTTHPKARPHALPDLFGRSTPAVRYHDHRSTRAAPWSSECLGTGLPQKQKGDARRRAIDAESENRSSFQPSDRHLTSRISFNAFCI